jgi:anti-sigma factor RsiW
MMDKQCERFERLISDALDGEISSTDETALRTHLSQCEKCRDFQGSAILCRERLRSLPDLALDSSDSYSSVRITGTSRFWIRRVSLPIPVAAALAAFMIAGWLMALRPIAMSAAAPPSRPVLVRSVEIIRVEPAQVAPVEPSQNDSVNQKEDEI